MVEPLAALGLGSRAVEMPSCDASPGASGEASADMHADAVRAALAEEDEPVVLVGHSYGGMVITNAAAGQEHVEHLVYVTSVMPERGETLAGFGAGREPGPWMDPHPEDGRRARSRRRRRSCLRAPPPARPPCAGWAPSGAGTPQASGRGCASEARCQWSAICVASGAPLARASR